MSKLTLIAGSCLFLLCTSSASSKIVDFNNIDEMTLAAYHVGYAEVVGMTQTHIDLSITKVLTGSLPVGRVSVLMNLQWEQGIDGGRTGDRLIVFLISKEVAKDGQYEAARMSPRRMTWTRFTEDRWKRVQDILSGQVEPVPYAKSNAEWFRQMVNR